MTQEGIPALDGNKLSKGEIAMKVFQSGTAFSSDEKSVSISNIQSQVAALKGSPTDSTLKGTYSTKHLFDSYRAGIDHVGGIAALSDGRFALVHSARPGKKALVVVADGTGSTKIISVGDGDHAGGIQAAGKVIVIPIYGGSLSGSQFVFVDTRNRNNPVPLSHLTLTLPSGHLTAAGIAFHPAHKCHYLIATKVPDYGKRAVVTLYKSNRTSLFDSAARFELVGPVSNLYSSQGGTQLLVDTNSVLYVAALYRTEPGGERGEKTDRPLGEEHIALSRIDTPESSPTATLLVDRKLYDTGQWTDYDAGFRWGGTITTLPGTTRLMAVAVSRTLTYGPAQNYAKLRLWI